jgi:Holliday junction resolvase RusA-like endonuclease
LIHFTIPFEPASKANSRQIVKIKGRQASIKSQKARDFETAAAWFIPQAARQMLTGEVCLTANIFYSTERPDMDESVVLDVLQAKFAPRPKGSKKTAPRQILSKGVYVNDRQVRERHIFHGIDKQTPRVEIWIRPRNQNSRGGPHT